MSGVDKRGTATWQEVRDWFEQSIGPGLGRPTRGFELSASPDGERIVFSALVLDRLEGFPRSAVCTVTGGEVTAVSQASSSARLPKLSPDSRSLAFLSDRAQPGVFQLYLLEDSRFGEARPAPFVPGTVEHAAWSPDGTRILLGVAGFGADVAAAQGSGTVARQGVEPVPAWFPMVEAGPDESAARSAWVYDIATDQLSRVSPPGLNVWELSWLGDGAIVAVTSTSPDEGAWFTAELSRLDLDGTVSTLYRSEVQLGLPVASPSGETVAVVEAVCSDRAIVAGDVLVSQGGGVARVDTAGVDVTCLQWLSETELGVFGLRGLETVAAVLDLETGVAREVWTSTDSSCGAPYPQGAFLSDGRVVVVEDGYHLPPRVAIHGGGESLVLASLENEGCSFVLKRSGRAESVTWTTPDGMEIEGILALPEGEGPFPLVVSIHGGPVASYRNQWTLGYGWTPLFVSRGYAVLHPNPRGSSGRGQDFARHVFGDMGGAEKQDFLAGVDALVERGLADPHRLYLTGGSYGGFMTAWLVTLDHRFAAAAPIVPVTNWFSHYFTSNIPHFDEMFLADNPEDPTGRFHSRSPALHASTVTTPCLNIAGGLDRCTPSGQAQEFHRALIGHGVESQLVVYPQEGHGVRGFDAQVDAVTRLLDFFDEHRR